MTSKLTLYKQITLLCVALVFLTAISLLGVSLWNTVSFNEQQINQRITSAENVLKEYLKAKEDLLVTASKVLTADFGFKQAVATRDKGTIESVLQNQGARINASLMILTDTVGQLISSNDDSLVNSADFTFAVNAIKMSTNKTQLAEVNGSLYQLIALPVKAPRTIAYAIIGFKIDQAFVNELKRLTDVDISFYHNDDMIISTLGEGAAGQETDLNKMTTAWLFLERAAYENKRVGINSFQGDNYFSQLSADLSPSYLELDKLLMTIIVLSVLIICFAVISGSFLARSLTRPLNKLTELANAFAQGHYQTQRETIKGSLEVNDVYASFIKMGQKILERENKISYQAEHDALTGLYNRSTLMHVLADYINQSEHKNPNKLLVMGVNIRNFKRINDSLGSDMGDLTLVAVAERINRYSSEREPIVGRLSGVEFFIAIPYDQPNDYEQLIDAFLTELKAPVHVSNLRLNLNFRVGACLYPSQGSNAKELVRRTTIALDATKTEHRSFRLYKEGEDEAHLERLNLVEELREVMAGTTEELFMVYQPKLNLKTQKIEKVESLIRWIKADGTFVSPELFIDLAEQSGLIIKLTHWVLDSVLKQQASWAKSNLHLKVAINISAQDIAHADFIDFLFQKIDRYQVDPNLITLELTERDIMTNEDLVVSRLNQLKRLGIQISVDDYGIGQSSLGKLKQLPIDELKIDKTFILELDQSEKDQQIVSSTIELSHKLGLTVVAEGVENEASLNMLREMNCDHIQGYFLSRPVKSDVLIEWLGAYDA
ncbi:EAL domain-containing protein [Alkalimarinus sediminis]|uniref:EAL domain-containing protein n=1 Tax=Alkalimarinus sediminis TaxID=1632866 RepID=A0A9E8HGK2_9ALTE|nr:EAL domain-containing protein [Alkalimarinus sediminis]UZW74278.1 EAL domain-containing protein [Alkalimarinus sediminis]